MLPLLLTKFRFRDLQNYTTLKLPIFNEVFNVSFRDLQNYTTLKRDAVKYAE